MTHTVTVTVVDPSGADASVTVVITVNNVNDPPAFASDALKTLWVTENGTALRTGEDANDAALQNPAYAATDDDAADGVRCRRYRSLGLVCGWGRQGCLQP